MTSEAQPGLGGTVRVGIAADGRVATVELDRPETGNALTGAMLKDLAHVFRKPPAGTGVILLYGAGRVFCSGVDGRAVTRAVASGWGTEFEELVDATRQTLDALLHCPVPLVAAVDGVAAGAGVTYALLADARIVTARTCLRPGHLEVGAPLDGGASIALKRAMGAAAGMTALLDPRGITGEHLMVHGLTLGDMTAPGDREEWIRVVRRLADTDTVALRCARTLLASEDFDAQWQAEVEHLRQFVQSGRLSSNLGRFWAAQANKHASTVPTEGG